MKYNPWADLVMAMLSVNNYSLEKTFCLFEGLREKRFFDPEFLASCDPAELARRLVSAGYSRGNTMTAIFTDRLVSLGRLTNDVPVDVSTRILSNGTPDEVATLLEGVQGVGPKVLDNFFILRGDK